MMDTLDHIAAEKRVIDHETRVALLDAVQRVAAEHDGLVHASWLRPALPKWVTKSQSYGAFVNGLVRSGVLIWTGEVRESENWEQRNGKRLAKVYRYVPEAVTA